MRTPSLLTFAGLLLALAAAPLARQAFAAPTPPAEKAQPYENRELGFRVTQPKGWDVDIPAAGKGTLVTIGTQREGENDKFSENVAIAVVVVPDVTVEDLVPAMIERNRAKHENFKVVSSKPTKLGAAPAHEVVYTGTQGGLNKKVRMILAVRPGGKIYMVTYTGSVEGYDKYQSGAATIVDSFKFTAAAK